MTPADRAASMTSWLALIAALILLSLAALLFADDKREAWVLGLIAGVAEFIPYLGPILAAIPAGLVAVTKGTDALIWTIIAYILIHQAEGNLIGPIVQREMLYIPPAVILLGIISISFLFGAIAIVFAAPMVVMLFVLIKKLYVRETLGEKTSIPGETEAP